ncbi:ATP-dependent DNA helicase RecQ-like [Haliotis rufescens]|uniref:ATP-dependent DNA helicase RecQ-like n=1 Tax=Haliotis rufescens TaxID=6454 RepID=UPI00201F6FD3|nr:ATP-dependent DNA helicase RecQ-like [Haliotis rufescens]
MAAEFETALAYAKDNIDISFKLKDKQEETLKTVFAGRDCIAVLPTGYGKSLIFQLLPFLLQRDRPVPGIVIVVSPLNSLMQDQVISLCEKGVKACFLNCQGYAGNTFRIVTRHIVGDENDEREEGDGEPSETDVHAPVYVSMADLRKGVYNLVYAHPETLVNNKTVGTMLRSKIYQDSVCAVAIDEVHMISEWGPKFRTAFNKLSEVICIFPDAAHLALTATATPAAVKTLASNLQFTDHGLVTINPDRPNIYLEVKSRLPNIRKFDKLDDLIHPLAQELHSKLADFPVTIVYINNDADLGYSYQYVARYLGQDGYLPKDCPTPENRLFAQFNKDYTEAMKLHIIQELRKQSPKLRLVLATVALGMGLNAPSIARVMHFQPPTTLEKYFQEIGRAGRSGQPSSAVLFYNKSDIAANREDMTDAMVQYCVTKEYS